MAKPMIVTLPFVLLLLDVWPLRRAPRQILPWQSRCSARNCRFSHWRRAHRY